MIVADTSALISLATVDLLDTLIAEYDVHSTEAVVEELTETATYDDVHGRAAQVVLDRRDGIEVHEAESDLVTARIDAGEASAATLAAELGAEFLLTDDLRALPELQTAVEARVAISPIVLAALLRRGVLDREAASEKLDRLAQERDWLGAPIYRRAQSLPDSPE